MPLKKNLNKKQLKQIDEGFFSVWKSLHMFWRYPPGLKNKGEKGEKNYSLCGNGL
jgi:hypothetical protein